MKREQGKRLMSLLLSVLLVVGLLPTTARAEENTGGRFILVAEGKKDLIIAPEYVTYSDGQKIGEVLENSKFNFTFSSGLITAINDVTGNYSISDQNGNGDLNGLASSVTHYRFRDYTENSDRAPSQGLQQLMTAMADYLEEEPDVQKAAKAEYQAAYRQFVGIDSASAKTLAKTLTDAVADYKAIQNGQTYSVRFTDGSKVYSKENFPDIVITASNAYDKQWTDTDGDGVLDLPYGSYHFCVTRNGLSVSGTLESANVQHVAAAFPEGNWLTEFRLSGGYDEEGFAAGEFDVPSDISSWIDRKIMVPVADTFSGAVYTYARYDETILQELPTLTAVYTMKNETFTPMEKALVFKSWVSKADSVLEEGPEGNTVIYRVSSVGADGYTYSQDYTVEYVRIPTLASITVRDQNGTDQAATTVFDGNQNEYTYKVLDTITQADIAAVPFAQGYEISINGQKTDNGQGQIPVSGADIDVSVSANGYTNSYILKIQPGKGQTLIFSSKKEVTLQVVNSNGVEIPYTSYVETDQTNKYLFTLVPGEAYHYVATYNQYYHIADELSLKDYAGSNIKIDFEQVEDWMTGLAFGTGESSTLKNTIGLTQTFDPEKHHYQVDMIDTEHLVFAWVSALDSDISIDAMYQQLYASSLYHGKPYEVAVDSGKATGTQIKRVLMDENPIENSVTFRLSRQKENVTYFQDYVIDFRRTLSLEKITAECDGASAVLIQKNNKTGFSPDIKEYSVKVSMAAKELALNVAAPSGSLCPGETQIGYRITVEENGEKALLQESGKTVIALDGTIDTQTVTITVANDKAEGKTTMYVLDILKAPPVEVSFHYTPSHALLNIREVLSGERIWPDENGKFHLCEGYSYDYVLTAYDYVSRAGRLKVSQNASKNLVVLDAEREYPVQASGEGGAVAITWNLTAAAPNESIDASIESDWPDFRGDPSNNAITDVKIPTVADEGTLYWARQIGSGIDSDAVGSPILVDGDIVTYASNKIYRINTITGQIVATGNMDHKSSFSITPPAYAEGMVFVALSNGCIQAFNAKTLESLWIYNDPLGGQPNCPIVVKDGYLYTGFWNSETGNACFVSMTITDEDGNQGKEEKHASWFHTQKGGFYWTGAYVGSDFILVGTDDGTNAINSKTSSLLLMDAKTGKLLDSLNGLNGDIRSSIVYDNGWFYFTSKGGSFYGVQVTANRTLAENWWSVSLQNDVGGIPMSTSSPVVYNGRAYLGVSGAGQFSAYSGHNITVIDLASKSIAYRVPTQGYPQTSGLLTTAYGEEACVYFFDNYTPGKLRVLKDKPGRTSPVYTTLENGRKTAYALFTPTGDHAQYAICSPIADEYGTVYFKNDSAHLMAFGSTIAGLEVTKAPVKTTYVAGEQFDPTGIEVTAVYSNGKRRDVTAYVTFSTEPLQVPSSGGTAEVTISFPYVEYQNQEDAEGGAMKIGVKTTTPTVKYGVLVENGILGDVNGDGYVTMDDAQLILQKEAKLLENDLNPMVADVSGDGVVDSNDAVLIAQSLEENKTTE